MTLPTSVDTKKFSYRALTPSWRVFLGHDDNSASINALDVTRYVEEIDNIDNSVDYPNLLEFRTGEASFTLNDANINSRRFDPNNTNSVYTTLYLNRKNESDNYYQCHHSGNALPVKIYAGFFDENNDRQEELVFSGVIHKVSRNDKEQTVSITVVDIPKDLQDNPITDFGLNKTMGVVGYTGSTSGEYPLGLDVSPPSHDSMTGKYASNKKMNRVKALRTEGPIDPGDGNFVVEQDQFQVEGGLLKNNARPIMNFNAPYRNKKIDFIVNELLEHYGIYDTPASNIEIPELFTKEAFFSSNGRIGYDIEASDNPDNIDTWRWKGYVTDYIKKSDVSGDKYYVLYSARETGVTRTQILEYDKNSDSYRILHVSVTDRELWSITTSDYKRFYLLGTEIGYSGRPPFGTYDSGEKTGASKVKIWQVDLFYSNGDIIYNPLDTGDSPVLIKLIDNVDTHPPQLAKHYHVGVPAHDLSRNRLTSLPFTQKLTLYPKNNPTDLYYLWARAYNGKFGVAKKPLSGGASTAIMTANRDTYMGRAGFNTSGCAYTIDGDTLYAAFDFIDYYSASSTFAVYKKTL